MPSPPKCRPTWLSVLALGLSLAGRSARSETIQEAWTAALNANPGFQSARIGVAVSQNELSAARRERIPTVRTGNSQTFLSQEPSFKVDSPWLTSISPRLGSIRVPLSDQNFFLSSTLMNIPLYTGGRIQANVDRAGAELGMAGAEAASAAQDLKYRVVKAYLEILRLEKILRLAETNADGLASHTRDVRDLYGQGLVSRNDVLSVEASLAGSRQRVLQAQNELDSARASYNQLLGRPLAAPTDLEEVRVSRLDPAEADRAGDGMSLDTGGQASPADEAEIRRLTELALRSRPELAGLAFQGRAFEADARLVESGHKPQLGVVGGYTYFQDSQLVDPNFWSGSLVAECLLFDGHRAKRRADALRLRREQTAQLRQEAASQIALSVRHAWVTIKSDRARLIVSQTAIKQAEENTRVARERYRQQVGTNTEVLDAETLRVHIFTDYYNAYYDLVLDEYMLRRATGML